MLRIGQKVEFRTSGKMVDGFISRIVRTDEGEAVGAIVDSVNHGSFFILTKVSQLPAGALVKYGSVEYRIERS